MTRGNVALTMVAAACFAAMLTDCDTMGQGGLLGGLSSAACPEFGANVDAFGAVYTNNPKMNAKIRAFVQASKDLAAISAQAEAEAAEACSRIGYDIGLTPQQMAPREEAGGRASGACVAVAARMDAILAQTGLRFTATVIPPQCQASGQAYANCQGACNGQAQGSTTQGGGSADAECNASCKAQSEFRASCTPARVTVTANTLAHPMAPRLIASLQANLPLLIHAQIALGRRVLADADATVQVGRALPNIIGQAGAHAMACVATAANASVHASASIKVSVQASASVSGRAGAGG